MKKIKEKYIHIFGATTFLLTFIVLFIIYGICYAPDSYGYMDMNISREPMYPLFLKIFRTIFGAGIYASVAVIAQIVLAVYAVFSFSTNITKRFNIKGIYIVSVYFLLYVYFFMALPLYIIIKLDSPLVSFPLSILTEGITYSLYLLYAKSLILAGSDKDYKNLFWAMGYACVMSLTRAGLMPTIIATVMVGLYISVTNNNKVKKALTVILVGVFAFIFIFVFENAYFYVNYGRFMTHTYGPVTALSNILYTSDETDNEKFEDEKLREIFDETYLIMKENGWAYSFKPDLNLIERSIHIEGCHDNIKFRAFDTVMDKEYEKMNITDSIEQSLYKDSVARSISKVLLKEHIGRWIEGYFSLCIQGYIRSIAYDPQIFLMRLFTLVMTLIFISGMILFRKNEDIMTYSFITLLSIAGIVLSASLVIMCMTRYMIYNFVVFYTAFIIMWCNRKDILSGKKGKLGENKEMPL